jgi:eukaryotic-like serine/threonine-protein kinase
MSHAVDDIFANKHNVTDDPRPDKMNNDIKTHKDAGIIDWPVFGGNPARTGRSAETIKPPLRLEWEFPTKSYIEASPVVYDNIIYFGTRDKKFYALDAMTGQKIWEFDTQGMVMSSPVVNDGTIYFTSVGDCLYALEAKSGALLWKFKLSAKSLEQIFSNARSHPLVLNNAKSTFVCLPLSNLSFINSTNGECQDLLSKEVSGVSTPAFCDGILYFAVRSHRLLVALDVFSMKEIWVVSTPRSVRTGPVVSKDFIFYGTKRNVMYGHRIRDGERVWEFHITHEPIYHSCEGIESSPAVFEDTLYFGGPDGWLYALDTLTGLDIWSFNIGSDITSSPLLSGDNLFVSAEGRKLYCFDKNIGEKKWEYGTERGFKSGPVASGNMLYCGSNILYAFSGMDD